FTRWGRFRRFPEAVAGIWADDGKDPLSDAGSSLAAADLCLAELRSLSEISGADGFPGVLVGEARRSAVLGDGRAFQSDQAGRASRGRRSVPAELKATVRRRMGRAKRNPSSCGIRRGMMGFASLYPSYRPEILC